MKVFVFIVATVIFLASLYAFAIAFWVQDVVFVVEGGWSIVLFIAAIVGVSVSFAIPFHVLKRIQP